MKSSGRLPVSKQVGVKTVEYIVTERDRGGAYTGIENFIHRIFRYKLKKYSYWDDPDNAEEAVKVPVNARHVKHMILAGCFDRIEKSRGGYRTLRAARTRSTGTGILPF